MGKKNKKAGGGGAKNTAAKADDGEGGSEAATAQIETESQTQPEQETINNGKKSLDAEESVDAILNEKNISTERTNDDKNLNALVESQREEIDKLKAQLSQLSIQNSNGSKKQSSKEDENGNDDISALREQLEQAEQAREEAEQDYENLREKVSHIKSTLGERLKTDAAELADVKEQNVQLQGTIDTLQKEVITANKDTDKLSHELSGVRQQYQQSLDEWDKEKEKLTGQKQKAHEEAEKYKSMYTDLEVAILEERAQKENFNSKLSELQEQVATQTGYAEEFRKERDQVRSQLKEAEENVNSKSTEYDNKLAELQSQNASMSDKVSSLESELEQKTTELDEARKELERLAPMEKETKEKSLLIGKLRHEAVILNEHLTKALRMIKKDGEGETVDKQLISNLIISFVTIPRGDGKKFEVLQLLSNFLGWEEEQKIQAGLSRGNNTQSSSKPTTPRSSISGNNTYQEESSQNDNNSTSSGGFMGLFAEFLEREASSSKKS